MKRAREECTVKDSSASLLLAHFRSGCSVETHKSGPTFGEHTRLFELWGLPRRSRKLYVTWYPSQLCSIGEEMSIRRAVELCRRFPSCSAYFRLFFTECIDPLWSCRNQALAIIHRVTGHCGSSNGRQCSTSRYFTPLSFHTDLGTQKVSVDSSSFSHKPAGPVRLTRGSVLFHSREHREKEAW